MTKEEILAKLQEFPKYSIITYMDSIPVRVDRADFIYEVNYNNSKKHKFRMHVSHSCNEFVLEDGE